MIPVMDRSLINFFYSFKSFDSGAPSCVEALNLRVLNLGLGCTVVLDVLEHVMSYVMIFMSTNRFGRVSPVFGGAEHFLEFRGFHDSS